MEVGTALIAKMRRQSRSTEKGKTVKTNITKYKVIRKIYKIEKKLKTKVGYIQKDNINLQTFRREKENYFMIFEIQLIPNMFSVIKPRLNLTTRC